MSLSHLLREAIESGPRRNSVLIAGDLPAGGNPQSAIIPAAVLIPVVERPEPSLILTLRPSTMRRHAGQISFPGGRIDPSDAGPVEAALREAEEEIGLPQTVVDVIGTLDLYRTITGFEVTPVIGVVPPDIHLQPHPDEVEDIFEAPLRRLIDPVHHVVRRVKLNGIDRCYYEIDYEGRRIWGATASMIVNLSRRLELAW